MVGKTLWWALKRKRKALWQQMNTDFYAKFKAVIQDIETVGEEYALAKAESWASQELKGSILASIINRSPEKAVSRAELDARASDDYQKHIEETKEKIRKELSLKAKYESLKARFEAYRSLSSLEKRTQDQIGD